MNETAAMVFALCDGQRNVGEIVSLISEAYPESSERIESDVLFAVTLLRYKEMIDITPGPSRIIYDVSQSGLGDRLRGLVSCLALADLLRVPFSMRWSPDDACDAWFHDLFEIPDLIDYLDGSSSVAEDPSTLIVTERLPPSGLHTKYRLYIPEIDYGTFRSKTAQYAKSLSPVRSVVEKIRVFKADSGLDKSFVGLHIRRTDHPEAATMTDEVVDAIVEYEQTRAVGTRFFLATDNRHTQRRFLRRSEVFSYPVQWHDPSLPEWGGPAGGSRRRHCSAIDSLIDLYLLAECGRIYALGSSFSYYAGMLGDVDVVSAKSLSVKLGAAENG